MKLFLEIVSVYISQYEYGHSNFPVCNELTLKKKLSRKEINFERAICESTSSLINQIIMSLNDLSPRMSTKVTKFNNTIKF